MPSTWAYGGDYLLAVPEDHGWPSSGRLGPTGSVEVMKGQVGSYAKGDLTMFATVARFCVTRRRWVLAAWMLLLVIGLAAVIPLFGKLKNSASATGSESARGAAIVDKATSMGPTAVVLVKGPPVVSPGTRAAVQTLTAKLDRVPNVTGAVNAYTSPDPQLRSRDGHASLIVVSLAKNAGMMTQNMTVGTMPGAQVQVGGDAGAMADNMTAPENDLVHASLLAFPILLVELVFIFRGLRAALVPIIASLAAMATTFIALLGVTGVTSLAPYATDVVMLLGLGLAVDYSLLMVNRFREARG